MLRIDIHYLPNMHRRPSLPTFLWQQNWSSCVQSWKLSSSKKRGSLFHQMPWTSELNWFTNCRVIGLALLRVCTLSGQTAFLGCFLHIYVFYNVSFFPGETTLLVFSWKLRCGKTEVHCFTDCHEPFWIELFHQLPCQSVNLAPCLRLPWKEHLLRVFYML